ncbi:MAG: PspC domain-containing protein [Saprospiraceae bacterium]|nr:PspC domain-containing protein [Saprospiraceae bacterium]
MKKNFTVNISGIIFNIDEDAFEKLNNYLDSIKKHFNNSVGKDEIISDIEARIAEMLKEKTNESKNVVTIDDINNVIEIMGQPFEFDSEDDEPPYQEQESQFRHKAKRLFRDPDNKMVGGVAAGIGEYFHVDPLWFRLAFIVTTFIGGSGFLVYLILWIAVPEARTTAEKLEMKGEKVNINNIEKSIKEEVDHLKDKLNDLKNEAKDIYKKKREDIDRNSFERLLHFFVQLIHYFVKSIIIIVSLVLIITGLGLIIAFFVSFFGNTHTIITNSNDVLSISVPDIFNVVFASNAHSTLAIIGVSILIGVPLIMLIYNGIKLLFQIKYRTKFIGLSAFSLWIVGLILCGIVAFQLIKDFSFRVENPETVNLNSMNAKTLYLEIKDDNLRYDYESNYYKDDFCDVKLLASHDNLYFIKKPRLIFEKSRDEDYHLLLRKSSRGSSKDDAFQRTELINYKIEINDSSLLFPSYFKLSESSKWRDQELRIILKIPIGKAIIINEEIARMTDRYRYDFPWEMDETKYIMTKEGLEETDALNEEKDTITTEKAEFEDNSDEI